jgi:spermidine dehydrogenase
MAKKLKNISRRDFLNGTSILIAAGMSPAMLSACADVGISAPQDNSQTDYPPRMTGMRGSHSGSFEVAHDLARNGVRWDRPEQQTGSDYDLVVVGGGISGLSAAYFYRQRFGADARILVLDNHDDFGGHAKRNEFNVDGETLLSYGGSQTMVAPSEYSATVKTMLDELGIVLERFHEYFDRSFFAGHDMGESVYFDREHYGEDTLAKALSPNFAYDGVPDDSELEEIIASYPISQEARDALRDMYLNPRDYFPDLTIDAKRDLMRSISYEEFIGTHVGLPEDAIVFLRKKYIGNWAIGWDVLSGMEGVRMRMPGTYELGLGGGPRSTTASTRFIFPDGNASLARLLARKLIPEAIPGDTMEDIVVAHVDYGRLDTEDAPVQIRLSSTVIEAKNTEDGTGVDIVYVKDDVAHRVRAKHTVMAGYAHMLPFICPELPEEQKEALEYPEKTPLVYVNIALRNWHAFKNAGVYRFYSPQAMFPATMLGYPVSLGDHAYPTSPDEPIVLVMQYCPITPGQGYNMKEQSVLGRQILYSMPFEAFEENIIAQLTGALGPYGFDAERDIAGITVNRWPHGYAYEYNELEDDPSFGGDTGPHIAGRARIGRITMANSDSHASAYLNAAVEAADRAIDELLEL